ncbi:hypothetical protein A6R68_22152, partial [Neotoma lepida]
MQTNRFYAEKTVFSEKQICLCQNSQRQLVIADPVAELAKRLPQCFSGMQRQSEVARSGAPDMWRCVLLCKRPIQLQQVYEHQDGSKSLKLGDFGLATIVDGPLYTVCGTPTYVAPEIIAETGYGLKVDIWAAGVITYILLCGFPPFRGSGDDQEVLFDQILMGQVDFPPPYWDNVSDSAKELINMMLLVNVDQRFSALQVLEHPWV